MARHLKSNKIIKCFAILFILQLNENEKSKYRDNKESYMRGRPTKYDPAMCEQVEKLCMLGATDEEIASFFNIDEDTLNRWKHKYKELYVSINKGKVLADTNVAHSLYKRAIGWKNLPPDVAACIFWLKNRRRVNWKEKHDNDNIDFDGRKIIPTIIITPSAKNAPIAQIATIIEKVTNETQE